MTFAEWLEMVFGKSVTRTEFDDFSYAELRKVWEEVKNV